MSLLDDVRTILQVNPVLPSFQWQYEGEAFKYEKSTVFLWDRYENEWKAVWKHYSNYEELLEYFERCLVRREAPPFRSGAPNKVDFDFMCAAIAALP